ncbi:MAG TPA: hypothetical protein PLZ93_03940 [Nocardioides sp.]|uniref:hypothetical protein n=1 Tax=uncultured Nocardioides sp. TaxID=198441 RepID=UPI0026357BDD|nr:hypothetical protein [uncultured Nocardioides sp.]HRD60880.1 hypothetical protein [Nocardioides sp.]HRI94743.1 hypothetical protein [Nocardioides sp.]HRK44607.1 hypothetical protein [Nocardioides sp.]
MTSSEHHDVVPFLDASSNLPLDAPFTAAVAQAQGVSRNELTQLCQAGALRQPIRRVYVAAQIPDSILLRAQCMFLVMPDDCVIVDRHAGWLHGAEMVLAPNEHLTVMPLQLFRPSDRGRLRNGLTLSGERNLLPEDITEIHGLPVTTSLRTTWDLGRVPSRQRSLAGMDQMLRLGVFSVDEFLAGIERFRGQRWVINLRTLALLADGRAESPGESAVRLGWIDAGLPAPQPQLEVWENGVLIARVDVGNPELGYIAEYDGVEWHTSSEQRQHDSERREAVSQLGFVVDAFEKHDVYGPRRNLEERLIIGAQRARDRLQRRSIIDLRR